jgi:hypothetical protein
MEEEGGQKGSCMWAREEEEDRMVAGMVVVEGQKGSWGQGRQEGKQKGGGRAGGRGETESSRKKGRRSRKVA